jgi:hypothetical protein
MCTSTLSAGPPIVLPLGRTYIPAMQNPQPQPTGGTAQGPSSVAPAVSSDPNRGNNLNIAV